MFEFFYVGLRRTKGVSFAEFRRKFGIDAGDRYGASLQELEREGFLVRKGESACLTTKGIALADSVYERFL
jgi:oxygen-independent coproporphyrinogen-3 oxidase